MIIMLVDPGCSKEEEKRVRNQMVKPYISLPPRYIFCFTLPCVYMCVCDYECWVCVCVCVCVCVSPPNITSDIHPLFLKLVLGRFRQVTLTGGPTTLEVYEHVCVSQCLCVSQLCVRIHVCVHAGACVCYIGYTISQIRALFYSASTLLLMCMCVCVCWCMPVHAYMCWCVICVHVLVHASVCWCVMCACAGACQCVHVCWCVICVHVLVHASVCMCAGV